MRLEKTIGLAVWSISCGTEISPSWRLRVAKTAAMMPGSVLSSSSVISPSPSALHRLGLCNPLGENQPGMSRRSELFAMLPVAYGLSHFAFGDFQAFGRGQHLQPLTDQGTICRRAIFHRTRSHRWDHREVTIG